MVSHPGSSECLRELTWRKNGGENMKTWNHGIMEYVFGFLLTQGVKIHFSKADGFSNSNLGYHTLPIPCNNQLNQFLEVINDWVNKTRKGSWQLDGFSLWHLSFPHWTKGLNTSPSLSLGNHAPISFNVALTSLVVGILIKCICTWYP